ncbi:MAG: T9SS type A sorting domain-containing protein, partial [Bacteroidetes bacterium]|nr:T9SS type A sorting domain-containing protein [Bacteroidota bacterium]
VALTGTNSASLPGYGFQAAAVTAGNVQAGSFIVGSIADQHTTSFIGSGSVQLIENKRIIPYTSGPGVYEADFQWTAPVAGKGTVTLYSVLLAADGDGTEAGDQANAATPVTIGEAGANDVSSVNNNIDIKAYPNPVKDKLQLKLTGTLSGIYTISVYDMAGKQIMRKMAPVNSKEINIELNANDWANGIYQLHIISDGLQRSMPILKN